MTKLARTSVLLTALAALLLATPVPPRVSRLGRRRGPPAKERR